MAAAAAVIENTTFRDISLNLSFWGRSGTLLSVLFLISARKQFRDFLRNHVIAES